MELYFVAWAMTVLGVLWALFGLPFWLVLAAITYFASRRSRSAQGILSDPADGEAPAVTRYARSVKTAAAITVGTLCLGGLAIGASAVLPGSGAIPMGLISIGSGLVWAVPAMEAAVATLFVLLIRDILARRRVAGRDSAIAYALATGVQAALLVGVLVAGTAGVQVL